MGRLAVFMMCALSSCSTADAAPTGRKHVVLLELFTSQGCSSCPAADELVRELPRLGLGRDKVVPLTFHVDYWDGLGWKDPFASPAFTNRQEQYARSGRLLSPAGTNKIDGLYTPQMIIDGLMHFSGRRRDLALSELRRATERPSHFQLSGNAEARASDIAVTIRIVPRPRQGSQETWRLVVALTAKTARTPVSGGENAGATLEEAAVVRLLSAPISVSSAPSTVTTTLVKPRDVAWADVALTAFIQSAATFEIAEAVALHGP